MSVFERDGAWVVKWKNGAGKWQQQRTTCATKTEARALLRKLETQAEHQRLGLEALERPVAISFGELLDWNAKAFPRKQNSDLRLATRHLKALAGLPLIEVTSARLDEVLTVKEGELSPKTLNNIRGWVLGLFNRAIARGVWNGGNPALAVPRRKVPQSVPNALKPDEVRALLEHVQPKWRGVFAMAIYTGMRRGEIVGLQKRDVDLDEGTVTVGRSWAVDTTKGRRTRVLPLHPELKPYLVDAIRQSPSHLVFCRPDGSMHNEHINLASILRTALNNAHLVDGWVLKCRRNSCRHSEKSAAADARPCPKCGFRLWPSPVARTVRFHDLRHTTATLMLKAGYSLAIVQRMLGHTDPNITANTYGHLDLDDMRAAVEGSLTFNTVEEAADVVPLAAVGSDCEEAGNWMSTSTATPTACEHGAPVVRKSLSHDFGARRAGENHQHSRPVTTNGPTRIRTWNQAVMSPDLPTSHGVAGGVNGAQPIANTRGAESAPFVPLDTGFTVSKRRGAPVVRNLRPVVQLLRVREVAELLAVSRATVYSLIASGKLERVWVSNALRVSAASLHTFLKGEHHEG